jgi:hypothetical protein
MSITSVTERFLACLDQLVADGKVKSKRHFALTVGYHAQGISEMVAHRRDAPLELIEKSALSFVLILFISSLVTETCFLTLQRMTDYD